MGRRNRTSRHDDASRRAEAVHQVEDWFVARGVPHFIVGYDARTGIWTRAVPVLVAAYVGVGLNALDIHHWSLRRNLFAAAIVMVIVVSTWVLSNVLRRRRPLSRLRHVGAAELAVFVVGPAVPSLLFDQPRDAIKSALEATAVLLTIYFATSYGVVPLMKWAAGRARSQLALFFNLVTRVLPLLLLVITFLFINAEVWQMSASLNGPFYWVVIGIFVLFGVTFVLTRVPGVMRGLATFADVDEIASLVAGTPADGLEVPERVPHAGELSMREKLNIGLVTIFSQGLQVTLIVAVVFGFFVLFGFLAIDAATQRTWTQSDTIHVLAGLHAERRIITEPLLRVSGFLAAFTGMYFTVVLSTDSTYREEFAEDVAPQVRQALAVRHVYRTAIESGGRRLHGPTGRPTPR